MRNKISFRASLFICAFLDLALRLAGQGTSGNFTGTVSDATGAVIQGSSVTVTSIDSGRIWRTQTNDAGVYTLAIEAAGFKRLVTNPITLEVNQIARLGWKIELTASYTYSHAMSNNAGLYGTPVGNTANPQNYGDLRAEWGPASMDIRHNFIGSASYELPFGASKRNTGSSGPRPNALSNPILDSGRQTPAQWFNTSVFVTQAPGTFGNAGPGIVRNPGIANLDFRPAEANSEPGRQESRVPHRGVQPREHSRVYAGRRQSRRIVVRQDHRRAGRTSGAIWIEAVLLRTHETCCTMRVGPFKEAKI